MIGRSFIREHHRKQREEWESVKDNCNYTSYAEFRRNEYPSIFQRILQRFR